MNIGFIILRHVNNESVNKYWIKCYDSIRKYYPENQIMIIDDNSNYEFITDKKLYKVTIIQSEYIGRGELLPYYYYLHNKLFDTAVIIHDSVFINKKIDFSVNNYKMLWSFEHWWDNTDDETKMLKLFNDESLLTFYQTKSLWKGCFGGMSIITHDYLVFINNKYDISKLLDHVLTRFNRMSFERVIGVLLQRAWVVNTPLLSMFQLHTHLRKKILLGDIHGYSEWDIELNQIDEYAHLPIIKVWTGR